MLIQKLEGWPDGLVLFLIKIKNVVELTSAFFECASPLAESVDVLLSWEDSVLVLKAHTVQVLDFLSHWSQVGLPLIVVNYFSFFVMVFHPFISFITILSSYFQIFFL